MSLYDVTVGSAPMASDVNQLVDIFDGKHDVGPIILAPQVNAPDYTLYSLQAQSGSTLGIGAYNYKFTYVTGIYKSNGTLQLTGETTASSAVSLTTTSGNTSIKVTLPNPPDLQTVATRIYRTAVGGSSYGLVATVKDGTTTYTDSMADGSRGATYPASNTTGTYFNQHVNAGGKIIYNANGIGFGTTNVYTGNGNDVSTSTNIDHIWFDDSSNQFNFVADDSFKAQPNAFIAGRQHLAQNTGIKSNLPSFLANNNADYNSAVWYWGGTSFTDQTTAANRYTTDSTLYWNLPSATTHFLYIGNAAQVTQQCLDLTTFGVGGVIAWEYWNGTAWTALTVSGGNNFTADMTVTFTAPADWATKAAVANSTPFMPSTSSAIPSGGSTAALYWIRIKVTTAFSTTAKANYVTPSPFYGNLADLKIAGSSKFSIDYNGNVTEAGTLLSQKYLKSTDNTIVQRFEIDGMLFFTNGGSNSATANYTFAQAFTTAPTLIPGSITSNAVSYSDTIVYPYIYNVSTTGFSVKLSTAGGANLGTTGQNVNMAMNFVALGN